MPGEHDYSADLPPRSRPRNDLGSPDDPDDRDYSLAPSVVPGRVRAAGIIWIVFGGLILVNAVANFALAGSMNTGAGAAPPGAGAGGAGCGVLFALAFIYVGVQSLNGTAKDTLGNAIGSIVFALLVGGVGAFSIIGGLALSAMAPNGTLTTNTGGTVNVGPLVTLALIGGGVNLVSAVGLLAAGVLALAARGEYKAYRRAVKAAGLRDD